MRRWRAGVGGKGGGAKSGRLTPVISTIDFSRIEAALTTPRGWIELGLVLACIGVAFLVDRRVERAREARRAATGAAGLHGSVVRAIFPVVALLLLAMLRVALKSWPPFFVNIALPAFYALVAIRLLVYGLRRLFPSSRWLPSSERAIAFTVWGAVVLYFVGVLPEMERILDEIYAAARQGRDVAADRREGARGGGADAGGHTLGVGPGRAAAAVAALDRHEHARRARQGRCAR